MLRKSMEQSKILNIKLAAQVSLKIHYSQVIFGEKYT
jgi:hypothetical protein